MKTTSCGLFLLKPEILLRGHNEKTTDLKSWPSCVVHGMFVLYNSETISPLTKTTHWSLSVLHLAMSEECCITLNVILYQRAQIGIYHVIN